MLSFAFATVGVVVVMCDFGNSVRIGGIFNFSFTAAFASKTVVVAIQFRKLRGKLGGIVVLFIYFLR